MKKIGIILFALLLSACSAPATQKSSSAPQPTSPPWGQHIPAEQFADYLIMPGAKIIDVRTSEEFAAGHLKGAVNINVQAAGFEAKIAALPKEGPYLIYCRSANRSHTAIKMLKVAGIENTIGLEGGISSWRGEIVKG